MGMLCSLTRPKRIVAESGSSHSSEIHGTATTTTPQRYRLRVMTHHPLHPMRSKCRLTCLRGPQSSRSIRKVQKFACTERLASPLINDLTPLPVPRMSGSVLCSVLRLALQASASSPLGMTSNAPIRRICDRDASLTTGARCCCGCGGCSCPAHKWLASCCCCCCCC
jgi:hypothetical protein